MRFELFYPVFPFKINQSFGVNGAYYQQHGLKIQGHNGLDLMAQHGQPVFATHDGVAYFETDDNSGEGVVLISNEMFDYTSPVQGEMQCYFKTIYWHLCDAGKEPQFKSPVLDYQQKNGGKGMYIKRGDLIGYADNTGLSTGDHLHFGLKPIKKSNTSSPEDATDEGIGAYQNVEQLNGFLGAIDPTPYLNGQYARTQYYFAKDFGIYSISRDVLELQKKLGVPPASAYLPFGIFGPKTFQAVKAYQKINGIPDTGYVGPLTRAALNAVHN